VEVLDDAARSAPGGSSVVAVGRFDGVHLGHRALLAELRASADGLGARAAVVVIDPDIPDGGGAGVATRISPLELKLELLAATGLVDATVVLDGRRVVGLPTIVADLLQATMLVAGADDPAPGPHPPLPAGLPVRRIPLVRRGVGGGKAGEVSAARIRELLGRGAVEDAAVLLGRPHEVRGVVGHGDARGRTLGFPTANIGVPAEVALPADGVYAGHYRRPDGSVHLTAISLGRRPTFYEDRGARLLEAYLLDFQGDLYDEVGAVRFERLLRPQERFDSVDALVAQLTLDVADTRRGLSAGTTPS